MVMSIGDLFIGSGVADLSTCLSIRSKMRFRSVLVTVKSTMRRPVSLPLQRSGKRQLAQV